MTAATDVVVTGCGVVSPIGLGLTEFERRMFAGDSGLVDGRGTVLPEEFPVGALGLVPRDQLGRAGAADSRLPLVWHFASLAVAQALELLPPDCAVDGVVFATGEAISFDQICESFRSFSPDAFDWDLTRCEAVLESVRDAVAMRGHGYLPDERLISLNSACISGNQAIAIGMQRIRSGRWSRVLVGAADARCKPDNLMNFHLLGALSTADVPAPRASCPFSDERCGFVRGEGGAALILESRETAERRGAAIHGVVAGAAITSDAHALTSGRPDVKAVIQAMRGAIADSGLGEGAISAISAHGTSTRMNDALETQAIKAVFGERSGRVPVTALKSQTGHATTAAGMIEAVGCFLMLQRQLLAPTINYGRPDPECDLDYVPNVSRHAELTWILSNNFGFGGQNASVVFGGPS